MSTTPNTSDIDWDTPVGYSHAERLRRIPPADPKPVPFNPTAVDRRADAYGLAVGVIGFFAIVVAVIGTGVTG